MPFAANSQSVGRLLMYNVCTCVQDHFAEHGFFIFLFFLFFFSLKSTFVFVTI